MPQRQSLRKHECKGITTNKKKKTLGNVPIISQRPIDIVAKMNTFIHFSFKSE
jgi:hypothetical protein